MEQTHIMIELFYGENNFLEKMVFVSVVTKADGQQEEIYEIFFHNDALKNEFGIPLFDVILDTVF